MRCSRALYEGPDGFGGTQVGSTSSTLGDADGVLNFGGPTLSPDKASSNIPVTVGTKIRFQVDNTYPGGDPRTLGYWKNWNRCTGGGQAKTADSNGGWEDNFWLLENVLDPNVGGGILWDDILVDDFLFPIDSCNLAVSMLTTATLSTARRCRPTRATRWPSLSAATTGSAAGRCRSGGRASGPRVPSG